MYCSLLYQTFKNSYWIAWTPPGRFVYQALQEELAKQFHSLHHQKSNRLRQFRISRKYVSQIIKICFVLSVLSFFMCHIMVFICKDLYLINYGSWMLPIFLYHPKGQVIVEKTH
jgi:ABC-type siderophore export system fused ATPase/permease subunit